MAKTPQLATPEGSVYGEVDTPGQPRPMIPQGQSMMRMQSKIVTAQKVALPRNELAIRQKLLGAAVEAGSKYYYSIPYTGKGGGSMVEGPTVKLASDAARYYGNCEVNCEYVEETATHFVFEGVFIDYETGYVLRRPYLQRKDQDVGIRDRGRAIDQVFQIAASKATRNVICRAIPELVDAAFEAARGGLVDRIGKNPDEWRDKMKEFLGREGVPVNRVERLYGKTLDKFTNPELAKLASQCSAVQDNMIDADLCWPETEEAAADKAKEVTDDSEAKKKKAAAAEAVKKKKAAATAKAKKDAEEAKTKEAAAEEEQTETENPEPPAEEEAEPETEADEAPENDTELKFD